MKSNTAKFLIFILVTSLIILLIPYNLIFAKPNSVGNNGVAWTTDETGSVKNKNIYGFGEDIYLSGAKFDSNQEVFYEVVKVNQPDKGPIGNGNIFCDSNGEFESVLIWDVTECEVIDRAVFKVNIYDVDGKKIGSNNFRKGPPMIFNEEFNTLGRWTSDYGDGSIPGSYLTEIRNGYLYMGGYDIESDGRTRDFVHTDYNLDVDSDYVWNIKARLSSDPPKAGTMMGVTLFFNSDIGKQIAVIIESGVPWRPSNYISIAESGLGEWRDGMIVSTDFKAVVDTWYDVKVEKNGDEWKLCVNGEYIGSGVRDISAVGNSNSIFLWNENIAHIDYIKIYKN